MERRTNASELLLTQTKKLLRQYGLRARKGLGQYFLVDPIALDLSISAAGLDPDDVVVEVGPGLGVLTEALAKLAKRVIAIECDSQIASILTKRFPQMPGITILNADVLQVDVKSIFGKEAPSSGLGYKVVANLPYYIAAPTIRRFLESETKPKRMVVMVQKEVAQNIVAAPGEMSILGVSVQLYGRPSIVGYVAAGSFYPSPKVDSAVVRIDVYERPAVDVEVEGFFRVVKAGFSAPRKQLRNSLAQGLSIEPSASEELLRKSGISPQRRAETLSLEEWAKLCNVIFHPSVGRS